MLYSFVIYLKYSSVYMSILNSLTVLPGTLPPGEVAYLLPLLVWPFPHSLFPEVFISIG